MATCTYTVPDEIRREITSTAAPFSQVLIDYFWNTYGFSGNKDYWDDGFGWEGPVRHEQGARAHLQCVLPAHVLGGKLRDALQWPDAQLGAALRPRAYR